MKITSFFFHCVHGEHQIKGGIFGFEGDFPQSELLSISIAGVSGSARSRKSAIFSQREGLALRQNKALLSLKEMKDKSIFFFEEEGDIIKVVEVVKVGEEDLRFFPYVNSFLLHIRKGDAVLFPSR